MNKDMKKNILLPNITTGMQFIGTKPRFIKSRTKKWHCLLLILTLTLCLSGFSMFRSEKIET